MTAGVLVHEWLSAVGGSEKVFDELVAAFPDADVQCLWSDDTQRYPGRDLHQSWMARTPLRRWKPVAAPLMLPTWRWRPGTYEWALVSTHAFAHHAAFRGSGAATRKYLYVHTPARYLWAPELDGRGRAIGRGPFGAAAPLLRRLDRTRAQEAYSLAANSAFVADRVRAAWGRAARVIHPPVRVAEIQSEPDWALRLDEGERALLDTLPERFVLGASRFVPYKALDVVIHAGDLSGVPVVIAGSGPSETALRRAAEQATVPVRFVIAPSDALLFALLGRAQALVFPPIEDFGILPVEAQAAGTPVVVGPVGGARETVEDDVTGVIAAGHTAEDIAKALLRVGDLDREACREHARRFDSSVFRADVLTWLGEREEVPA